MGEGVTETSIKQKIGLGLDCKLPINTLGSFASLAEEKSFDSLWAVQYYYFHDPYLVLSVASSRTKLPTLGTAVVNTYDRFPITTATLAASMQELSGGRFILGIGTSVSTKIEDEMGIAYSRPLRMLEESVDSIRDFLDGNAVSVDGDFLHIKGVRLGLKIPNPKIPIYLAAVGPKALRLAARIADGVILNYGTNIKYIEDAVLQLQKARKNTSQFEVASLVWFMPDEAPNLMEAAKKTLATFFSYPGFGEAVLPFLDAKLDLVNEIRKYHYLPEGRTDSDSAASLIEDKVVRSSMIMGKEDIPKRIDQYRRAGVNHIILMPYGGEDSLQKLIEVFDKSNFEQDK